VGTTLVIGRSGCQLHTNDTTQFPSRDIRRQLRPDE